MITQLSLRGIEKTPLLALPESQGCNASDHLAYENWEPSRSVKLSAADWESFKKQLVSDEPNHKFEASVKRAYNNKNFEIIDRV